MVDWGFVKHVYGPDVIPINHSTNGIICNCNILPIHYLLSSSWRPVQALSVTECFRSISRLKIVQGERTWF